MHFRITLEDDEDEDLDVEPTPRRPVLVISDSLKEGLQRGISDILPHTVAQSVYVILFLEWTDKQHDVCSSGESFLLKNQYTFVCCSGAVHAWSWCYGGHQMIHSAESKRALYRNYLNNRLFLSNPWLHVHLPPLRGHPAHPQTRTPPHTAFLWPTALGRRTWKCKVASLEGHTEVKDWTCGSTKKWKGREPLEVSQFGTLVCFT